MPLPGLKVLSISKGFSLIEILIVISIIAMVSGIGISVSGAVQKSTRDAQREADLRIIQGALQQYYADQNKFPNALAELGTGNPLTNCSGRATPCTPSKTYLSVTPKDPTGTSYYYLPLANVNTAVTAMPCSVSGATETGTCHHYYVCAKKENLAAGTLCNSTYNFQVTPL